MFPELLTTTTMYRLEPVTNLYDNLHAFWEHPKTQKRLATSLVLIFVFSFLGIQLNLFGLLYFLPESVLSSIPSNHFHSVSLAFTMLLFWEVLSLVFAIACSVSKAIGKQMEILALILLRNSFKELTYLHDPINFSLDHAVVPHIVVSSVGALIIFACLGIYHRMPRYHNPIPARDVMGYVMSKKIISLLLLASITVMGLQAAYETVILGNHNTHFFASVYTTLIFADILVVLISQRYLPNFQAMFRNSGYVIATLLMRISFASPVYIDTAIGVLAVLYALGITWTVQKFHGERAKEVAS